MDLLLVKEKTQSKAQPPVKKTTELHDNGKHSVSHHLIGGKGNPAA